MQEWITRKNDKISKKDILALEKLGLSDREIAKRYNLTPMGFHAVRKYTGWNRKYPATRNDKGKERKPAEEKHQKHLVYMREYQQAHKRRVKVIRIGNKVMAESRYIASQALGRPLKKNEIVHHIDNNPHNNEKTNLLICDPSYHRYLHRMMRFNSILNK